jgi:hypothetical protein
MVIGAKSACMIGAAVRNRAVRRVADGQTFLVLAPLFAACLLSDSYYLNLYAGFVALHIIAALALARFLNGQTVRLLLPDEEKSDLVVRLELPTRSLK